MADTDEWGGLAVNSQPKPDDWGGVPTTSPKVPDMSGVQNTARMNMETPEEGEDKQEHFGAKLDKAAGMPISSALGVVNNDIIFSPDMRQHLVDAYKKGSAIDASDFMQSAIRSIVPIVSQAGKSLSSVGRIAKAGLEGIGEGYESGKIFPTPIESNIGTIAGTAANIPLEAMSAGFSGTQRALFQTGLELGSPQLAKELALLPEETMGTIGQGLHMNVPHPEMQELVGKKLGKPAEAVTDSDIAQAIRMGFENKAPRAQDFKDTATVILGHGNEEAGIETLHSIYKDTGIAPDQVFEDYKAEPQIAADIKEGNIPKVYEPLLEKTEEKTEDTAQEEINPIKVASPPSKQEYTQILERRDVSSEHQEIEEKFGVPESMSSSQLGKLDTKIQGIFADRKQADAFSDEQYQALEDYARRVEAARDIVITQPIGKQIRNLITDESGSVQIPQDIKDFSNDIKRDVLNFATPMETGSARAQAAAKDFANKQRWAQWNGARITNMLKEKFSPEELKGMWNALDEASVHAQTLESNGMSREQAMLETEKNNIGHFKLPEEQREIIKAMSDWAQHSWDEAKRLGMVDGEGLPFWTPRMAAAIGEDGKWNAPSGARPAVNIGKNLRTSTGNLKERKYLTSEETEVAMQKAFGDEEGEGAILVRDIRTMPLALTRLEQAIAGRSLINEIKEMGRDTGAETISNSPHDGYFTLDHPSFQTYRPKLEMNDKGKWEVQKDSEGNDLFEKHPIYISNEFEGPLKAVLSQDSSAAYNALMELKGKSMGLIMYSPIIHNAVEWGRALPAMPGKVATFKIYFEGNRAKNDPIQMKEAINSGLVPIGNRYFNQDISSIIEQPNLTPGRSWTAKLLGGLTGEVSPKAGETVKIAIDKAGDFWHNTLLWDRVADLQMGLYTNIRDANIKNGMDPQAAQAMAAHIANRFAGALPMESMGNMARKMANITMFSRSFTIGNLGVMKDMFKGLPSDVMAQLKRDIGEEGAKAASNATQRKAIAAFALDIALMYAGNSILQDTFDHLKRDKSLNQIEKGYVDRYNKLLKKYDESPWDLLNLPADMQELSATSTNEPGKENRILFSRDPNNGTAYYMRMPTGKMGEEFEGWATSPLEMARKKVSPLVSPLIDAYKNEDYFGHPIYDKDAKGLAGSAENIGKVVTHFMEAQIPEDSIKSAYNLLSGQSKNNSLDYMKALGPLGGITFSKGYPGGPEAGILSAASKRHEAEVMAALPKIKEAIENDDEDKAREIMDKIDMAPREQRSIINHYRDPQGKVNSRTLRKFERIATPEERELMQEQENTNP